MPVVTVLELAGICGGSAEGDTARKISGANSLERATVADLSFAANKKALEAARASQAGCLLVPLSFDGKGDWALIRVAEPRAAFARAVAVLYPKTPPTPSVHPTAIVAESACIAADCYIGPYASIGEQAKIGSGCVIGGGCMVGDRVTIGENTTLAANVTLYDGVIVGARVLLHAGCVIGADGFGFTLSNGSYQKFPQIGTVEIADDVEIGANSCIDRAALGVTRIGRGTKLDNLVHVGHNCSIGEHVVIAAQTGFSGSVTVEDYAVIGGQVGVGEKAKIEARAIVGGKSGVLTSQVVHAGEPVWGIPARPLKKHLKGLAHVEKLPEFKQQMRELRQRLEKLEDKNRDRGGAD
ncbi:MAG TPA: UDP-3-O-(3-hydroxymyristoyl)glucosamine N-acyltransferase [Bryobacteraceae bacterium]